MNLINFFRRVTDSWNDTSKCGNCWTFAAPLGVERMNQYVVRKESACCVHLFLTRYNVSTQRARSGTTGLETNKTCVHNFELYAVNPKWSTGTMVDNEQEGYAVGSGLWDTELEALLGCLSCDLELDLCALGYDFDVTSWTVYPVIYEQDMNYVGWRVVGTFSAPQEFTRIATPE